MDGVQWMYGFEPDSMSIEWKERVRKLFLDETGEAYTIDSISNLQVPEWKGNLLLIDPEEYPNASSLLGVMWALPHEEHGVRIAAFVIDASQQSDGWGSKAWQHLVEICRAEGKKFIQLEVKAENVRAQKFYRLRGLEVTRELKHYYASGLGLEMKGPVQ